MSYALKTYEILRKEFEEKQACVITEAMENANELDNQRLIEKLATKEDIARLETRVVKWVFVFIMGQFWAIVGVLFVFFRK